jgi:phosphonatase-like hydrolase
VTPAGRALELVVLDLAGTTVHDSGEVPAAFAASLAADGLELAPDQLVRLRGASKRQAMSELVPDGPGREARAEQIYADFRERLRRLYAERGVRAVAGAEGAIAELRARGVKVALNTGFDREITDLLLGALGWGAGSARVARVPVDAVVCMDDVAHGRPHPDLILAAMAATGVKRANRVANAGDTTRDLEAAARAGVGWNVGVLSGAHDRATLERAPHTHLIGSVAELPALLFGL